MNQWMILSVTAAIAFGSGCRPKARSDAPDALQTKAATNANAAISALDPCTLVLAPHAGSERVDREIASTQDEIRRAKDPTRFLEKLGWLFVNKARAGFDPGFYKLAEQCALCLEARQPGSADALLLRGHALHNVHRFKEAEPLARELVARRGIPADFGLLGDVLMEQGRLNDAIEAYQRMMDLKPDLHSYARAAHMRWLKGDVEGAIEAMDTAAGAASPLDAESAAWVNTRLASYEFQAGHTSRANEASDLALEYHKDYPPALLLRGRMLLAESKGAEAIQLLQRATELNPLPEYQWALAEALRSADRLDDARRVESLLLERGTANDPRTLTLFLATRREQADTAVKLAERELRDRADIFTYDALAWSMAAAGRWSDAYPPMEKAMAEGTKDARLFLHAGIIAAHSGKPADARRWLEQSRESRQTLLPSEAEQLRAALAPLRQSQAESPTAAARTDGGNEFP
jgi:tetratricopeptide (TPR) repeat protein